MKFLHSWLQEYTPQLPSPQQLMDELTLRSVEVEGIDTPQWDNIVIGVLTTSTKHPKADRLQVCEVDCGDRSVSVVCGGSNLRVGMKVALAHVGARVRWHGQGELIVLEPVTIRGVASSGMICAAEEIGLADQFPSTDERAILDLSDLPAPAGTPLIEVIADVQTLIDIDNKSMTHRSDLFSHVGMAREIAAVFDVPHLHQLPRPYIADPTLPQLPVNVLDTDACRRYVALAMDVVMGETPDFIVRRLTACGMKSINVVVDISNYVLLEYGQPSHAFDADRIAGEELVVRRAVVGEQLLALDHVQHDLEPSMLVIADRHQPLALAGVIGGEESGVTAQTKRIVLEVANFEPLQVRKTAIEIGTRTESSLRFEKNLPLDLVGIATTRLVELLHTYAQAQVTAAHDSFPESSTTAPVLVEEHFLQRLIAVDEAIAQAPALLQRLGCTVIRHTTPEPQLIVTPPWFRRDIVRREDVVEEIVRLYGIELIPPLQLHGTLTVPQHQVELPIIWQLRRQLQTVGYSEVYNYSFYGEQLLQRSGIGVTEDHIEILNPLSEELRYLRVNLLPRLLETVERNAPRQTTLRLFEIGHVYFADREVHQMMVIQTGGLDPYRQLRGVVEQILHQFGLQPESHVITASVQCPYWGWYAGSQAVQWQVGETVIGTIGQLSPTIAKRFSIHTDTAFATISIPSLVSLPRPATRYQPISDYPSVTLDWSLLTPDTVNWQSIADVIKRHDTGHWVQSLSVMDVYRGETLPSGYHSLTVQVVLQSSSTTLTMPDIEHWRDQLMADLQQRFQVVLRDR